MRTLPEDFYRQPTLEAARALLGKILVRTGPKGAVSGFIVETEAYLGPGDPASHACRGSTPRSKIMFGPPGRAYVYFCYGVHHLLNVVTEEAGRPGAVLIRSALLKEAGSPTGEWPKSGLIGGPGRLTRVFGIDLRWNGWDLTSGKRLFLTDGVKIPEDWIGSGPRVGISRGKDFPWRFVVSPAFKKTR